MLFAERAFKSLPFSRAAPLDLLLPLRRSRCPLLSISLWIPVGSSDSPTPLYFSPLWLFYIPLSLSLSPSVETRNNSREIRARWDGAFSSSLSVRRKRKEWQRKNKSPHTVRGRKAFLSPLLVGDLRFVCYQFYSSEKERNLWLLYWNVPLKCICKYSRTR